MADNCRDIKKKRGERTSKMMTTQYKSTLHNFLKDKVHLVIKLQTPIHLDPARKISIRTGRRRAAV